MPGFSSDRRAILFLTLLLQFGCSSPSLLSQNKVWTDTTGRSLDGNSLIIVSQEQAETLATAKFKAEAKGLEDLANECSFVPRGTEIEDEVIQQSNKSFSVTVKIVVDQKLCENAQKSLNLAEISEQASLGYTDQILKNQSFEVEKSKLPPMRPREKVERILASTEANLVRDDADYFMIRQQIAFLKQAILLSSKGLYAKKLVNSDKMKLALIQKTEAVKAYEVLNPVLKSSSVTWAFAKERINQNLQASDEEEKSELPKQAIKKFHKERRPAKVDPLRPTTANSGTFGAE